MMMPLFSGIDARLTQEGWIATFLLGPMGGTAEDIPLTEQDAAVLAKLVEDFSLWSWAGFHESDATILDGEMFSFSASFDDGTQIDAHGSNCFPEGYWDAQAAILDTVESLMIAHGIQYMPE